jgi:hypothetical protein
MRVTYMHFESASKSWATMFDEAAAFATKVGRDRLIGISHSHGGGGAMFGEGGSGVVTVWYWEHKEIPSNTG